MLRNPRNIALFVLAGAAVVTLAACGSSGPKNSTPTTSATSSAIPSSAPATTADASAAPTTAAATTVSTASATSATGTTPQCAESQLKASTADAVLNASGQRGVRILFQNTSTTTCALAGYPGAAIVDSAGKQVTQATRTLRGPLGGVPVGESTYTPVALTPGASADAEIEGVNTKEAGAAQAGCDEPAYPGILVTPPNTTIPVPFSVSWPICESFEVHPVRPVS